MVSEPINQCDVLVLDGRLRQSLATVRSLGSRGVRVAALETCADAPAFSSRWCRYKFVCPAEEGSQEYFDYLMQVLDATGARVLITSSDGTIELLRRHREELEQRVKLALAREPALGIAIDKEQTLDIAERLGLQVPRGVLVSEVSEVHAALCEVGLPAVVKPTRSWTSNEQQGTRLASRLVTTCDEARRAVEELTCLGGKTLFQQFLLQHAQVSEATIEGRTYYLGNADERKSLEQAIETRLRNASSIDECEAFLAAMHEELLVPSPARAEEKAALPLTWEEVREMEASGWVSFDAHTMHHPTLSCLADAAELQYEVSECRAVLEKQLGHPVRGFAYPIGKGEHIGESGLAAVRAARYNWALTTLHGINTSQTDPHLLHRFVVDADQHWLMIAAKSAGVWDFFMRLCQLPGTVVRNIFSKYVEPCMGGR